MIKTFLGWFTFLLAFNSIAYAASPAISFSTGESQVAENLGALNLTVTLSEASTSVVSVDYKINELDAWNSAQFSEFGSGQDFYTNFQGNSAGTPAQRTMKGTLTFPPGETSKSITVYIVDDSAVEPDEKFQVVLENPKNAILGRAHCYVTIIDDDRDAFLDVTNLPATCPFALNQASWQGSSWNLKKDNADGVGNRTRFQGLLDYLKNYQAGKGVLLYFPAGTYLFNVNGTVIHLPLNTNKITLIGPSDGRDQSTARALLKMETPYIKFSRLLSSQKIGYMWSNNDDSEKNRLIIKNLVLDGDNINAGAYQNFELEASIPLFIMTDVTKPGRIQWTLERTHIRRSTTGGFNPYSRSVCKVYQCSGDNNYKGFVVMSGGGSSLDLRDVVSWGEQDPSSLWMEANSSEPVHVTGSNLRFLSGGRFYLSLIDGSINLSNVYLGKGDWVNTIVQANKGEINLTDSVLFTGTRPKMALPGKVNFANCRFISYAEGEPGHCISAPAPTTAYLAQSGCKVTFTDCVFSNESKHAGYLSYGAAFNGSVSQRSFPDEYFRFNNCLFDHTLDGGIRLGYPAGMGSLAVEVENSTFNCTNATAGDETGHAFGLPAWNDTWDGNLLTKYNTYNCSKIFKIYGFTGTVKQNYCWLFLDGNISSIKNQNCISKVASGIKNISVSSLKSLRISAVVRSTETMIVTNAPHNFNDGDKIMFDGFDSENNLNWFANLSPHSNVPIFCVDYNPGTMKPNEFKLRNANDTSYIDSSSYVTDYDNTKDVARVYLYPIRTIEGSTGDNPITDKPSGFAGDRYNAGGVYYRCITSGVSGESQWNAE